jgi:hypothetical protein
MLFGTDKQHHPRQSLEPTKLPVLENRDGLENRVVEIPMLG